jgi:hypothetical protein
MGKKPFWGLAGACLAGLALTGCQDNGSDRTVKKDTPPPWNQQRQAQTGTGGGNSLSGGAAVSGTNSGG